ncbi:hypothetical protein [Mesotoga sp.]|uniref:hypothetical protein n=1 Tax=Mesotoga sp. TaxID=2053577 RepID=UPI00345E5675
MDIENLEIWRLGVSLAKDVYVISKRIPKKRGLLPYRSDKKSSGFCSLQYC